MTSKEPSEPSEPTEPSSYTVVEVGDELKMILLLDWLYSSDVIDLTRFDATHHHTGCDSSVQPVFKKMKTKTPPVPVVLPQHLKEQEILDFLNSDRSGKVEMILRNAGVFWAMDTVFI